MLSGWAQASIWCAIAAIAISAQLSGSCLAYSLRGGVRARTASARAFRKPAPVPPSRHQPPPAAPFKPAKPDFPNFDAEALRRAAPAVGKLSDVMRCNERVPPESILTTAHGESMVTIFVRSTYAGKVEESHMWSFELHMTNKGPRPLRPLTLHWLTTDGNGAVLEYKGPAYRGELPIIQSGETWSFTDKVRLPTERGSLHGSFQFQELEDGDGGDDGDDSVEYRQSAAFSANGAHRHRLNPWALVLGIPGLCSWTMGSAVWAWAWWWRRGLGNGGMDYIVGAWAQQCGHGLGGGGMGSASAVWAWAWWWRHGLGKGGGRGMDSAVWA